MSYRYSFMSEDPDNHARLDWNVAQELDRYQVTLGDLRGDRLLEINRRTQRIIIRDEQPLGRLADLVDEASLFVIKDSDWAPRFYVRPKLSVVRDIPEQWR